MARVVDPDEARYAILRGVAPPGMVVDGDLDFDGKTSPGFGLRRLPHDLQVRRLYIHGCTELKALPHGLRCDELIMWDSGVASVPERLRVSKTLVIGRCPLKELPRTVTGGSLALARFSGCAGLRALPASLRVSGELDVSACTQLESLPAGLRLIALNAVGCVGLRHLPDDLWVSGELAIRGCTQIEQLPAGLRLRKLDALGCVKLQELPGDLQVSDELVLTNCTSLESLPEGLSARALYLNGCVLLRALPDGLGVQELHLARCTALAEWPRDGLPSMLRRLDISGCTSLTEWPGTGPAVMKRLDMQGCARLRSLPRWLRQVDELDIGDCPNLRELPAGLRVPGWIDIAGTPLRALPSSARGFRLRWRGVAVAGRVALHPETIRASEVLKEANAEVRRVMMERMGYDRFVHEAQAEVLDADRDAGGPRQLLRVTFADDEPLVCLSVRDPSTSRQYLLRVPPSVDTCRQAAAWIAGFDDPDDYRPVAET